MTPDWHANFSNPPEVEISHTQKTAAMMRLVLLFALLLGAAHARLSVVERVLKKDKSKKKSGNDNGLKTDMSEGCEELLETAVGLWGLDPSLLSGCGLDEDGAIKTDPILCLVGPVPSGACASESDCPGEMCIVYSPGTTSCGTEETVAAQGYSNIQVKKVCDPIP